MSPKNKILHIAYVPELDQMTLDKSAEYLFEKVKSHSIDSVNWSKPYSYKPLTSFYVARGSQELYISYLVSGNYLRAVNSRDQQPVQDDSCVSALFRNENTGLLYDFSFNCIGTCAATYGSTPGEMENFDLNQLAKIRRYADLGKRPFFEMEGLFTWQLTVAIPFQLLGLQDEELNSVLSGNFCKRADATAHPHFLSWNPIVSSQPEFLIPEYFGKIKFD
ncbi:MAG: carbohydrate-binding family 9-like protein [Bacteroidales bacterium]